jgi:hypothetical protein
MEPFNGDKKCSSSTNMSGYGIPKEGGKNALTNLDVGSFTISELEVWELQEIVRINMILIDYRRNEDKEKENEESE